MFTGRNNYMPSLEQAYFSVTMQLPVEDKSVSDRLTRAYNILSQPGYSITYGGSIDGRKVYDVIKLSTGILTSNDDSHYVVTNQDCTCPDYEKARAGLCKHRLAVMIKEEMLRDT
jgi:hypothetical protein